jgi:hypothetical protein
MIEQPIENLSAANFQTTDLVVQSLTATSINSRYNVAEKVVYSVKTFIDGDSSKAFHFDTGIHGPITAIFPSSLLDGFNVTILNTDGSLELRGSDTIQLSSNVSIKTINGSLTNSTTNTGMLIYKYDNQFYGVGTFD